ncbi:hypothetical protein PC116_g10118 [Phytophthora cactorum]|uniref:Uncharacterized protein n=1 Tax=Phytophthora cactorum TaxID=29920 RepID=A0A8T1KYV4_9STRA|nr:hypothetical protein PC114_g7364 [Phytophthora cactorum]KAG2946854.1 hypothetical protein PC117_g7322 [Phytophthora cactorum]KAG3023650.1 hypothetical protein PC120_g7461 [Phytophthora cactorum]KAG3175214.1 hypothetical protein C6341_g9563 [Phytophthora cactorum]KAG3187464.1 hypothetical protein PC128_g12584 [Phytophthora cactorum]
MDRSKRRKNLVMSPHRSLSQELAPVRIELQSALCGTALQQ